MIQKGYIAAFVTTLLVLGHVAMFAGLYTRTGIGPDAIAEIRNIIIPITVSAFTLSVLYGIRHANVRLGDTPKANYLFAGLAGVLPLIVLTILIYGVFSLSSDGDVRKFSSFVATAEAFFGGVFVLIIDALFGRSEGEPTNDT